VAGLTTPLLDEPMRLVSRVADQSKLWLATAAVLAALGGRTGRRVALTGVVAVGATSFVVSQPMKLAGWRARPDGSRCGYRSYVGADAGLDVVPVGTCGVRCGVRRCRRRSHAAPEPSDGVAAAAVCFSRVYTGVHYPGDVDVGAATGAVIGRPTSRVAARLARPS
jgi:undecaprenyl-diphosphatase